MNKKIVEIQIIAESIIHKWTSGFSTAISRCYYTVQLPRITSRAKKFNYSTHFHSSLIERNLLALTEFQNINFMIFLTFTSNQLTTLKHYNQLEKRKNYKLLLRYSITIWSSCSFWVCEESGRELQQFVSGVRFHSFRDCPQFSTGLEPIFISNQNSCVLLGSSLGFTPSFRQFKGILIVKSSWKRGRPLWALS